MENYQTECLRVVTIRYLKNFIGSSIQDSSGKGDSRSATVTLSVGGNICASVGVTQAGGCSKKPVSAVTPIAEIHSGNGRVKRCPDGAPSVTISFVGTYYKVGDASVQPYEWGDYTATASDCDNGEHVTISWPSDVDWSRGVGTRIYDAKFPNGSDTYEDDTTIWEL